MGSDGQLSRFTAPVTFVTHKLIPAPPGSDQLCLSDIHRALHLLGPLPSKRFCFAGSGVVYDALLSPLFHAAFEDLGFPYSTCHLDEGGQDPDEILARPDFGGAYVPDLCSARIGRYVQTRTPVAEQIGTADTVLVTTENGERVLAADNTAWMAILACLQSSGSLVSEKSTAVILGVDPGANAAYIAIERFGVKNAILVTQDEQTARQICVRFPHISFRLSAHLKEASAALAPESSLVVFGAGDLVGKMAEDGLLDPFSGVLFDMDKDVVALESQQDGQRRIGKWKVYSAVDVLRRQADVLFKLWTGREAPGLAADTTVPAKLKEKM